MENKITVLCNLLTEYYKERKGFSFEAIKEESALVGMVNHLRNIQIKL